MKLDKKNKWPQGKELLFILKFNQHGKESEIIDLKGIPFGNKMDRNNLENLNFNYVDFSFVDFTNCNFHNVTFSNCTFSNVNFLELRQWNCEYNNCTFEKSDFTNSTLGVKSFFLNCTFKKTKLKGKYFNFGTNNIFQQCKFIDCDIKSTWIMNITFKECVFESKFSNVRFSGITEANTANTLIEKTEERNYPATFINCDLKKSLFKDLEIMDGAIIESTVLPEQKFERFNNDRIYYP